MAPLPDAHHHHSTTKKSQKSFKSRHSTKSALKESSKGKVNREEKGHRRSTHQQLMSKLDRRNQVRQKQNNKHHENLKATSIFAGRDGAPRIVAVIPLTGDGDVVAAVRSLNASVDSEGVAFSSELLQVNVDRFKQKLEYILVRKELVAALDACRIADFVVLILSAQEEVDESGELMIKAIESQGVSNVLTVVQGLEAIEPPKRRPQVVASLKSFITHYLPTQEKIHSLNSRQECSNIVRSLCTTTPKGIKWREDRSWMLVEDVSWPNEMDTLLSDSANGPVLTGIVRGRALKADRLFHVGDWGDFQIGKITTAKPSFRNKGQDSAMAIDLEPEEDILERPTDDQDDLAELAPDEALITDADQASDMEVIPKKKGVLLDDHHYFSDDETHLPEAPKRLPKGTSSYQAAWYIGDISDSGSDYDSDVDVDDDGDVSMNPPALPQDGTEGLEQGHRREPTETAPSDYPQSEMFLDPSPEDEAEQLAAYRSRRHNDAEDDLEFPDEIELHPNVLARERLARYRGLKSLRTSQWETDEDRAHEPSDWQRLLKVADYKRASGQVVREALVGGVQPGKRVKVHLRNVPLSLRNIHPPSQPLTAFSLHRHEHKRAVVNYSITLSSDYPSPIKSKEDIIMQCGPRRFIINPLFSQTGNTPNNVHKFDRFLHPGRTAMATFIAPLTWGPVPTLFFQATSANVDKMTTDTAQNPQLELIGTGTSQAPDHSRVIAKRVILTGHPYKIHKKLVTVRYMFFNTEDVAWFKALQLWTRRGRSGYIKESLGTHGYFKATFDSKINPQDAVGVSLYKRVFPRPARDWNMAVGLGSS
ncbi:MAG: hypothetical protein M1835_006109 [Candelina submexicana]|nr:MAG: hypothetical protein M1835_006109 [Candelina submexicana]